MSAVLTRAIVPSEEVPGEGVPGLSLPGAQIAFAAQLLAAAGRMVELASQLIAPCADGIGFAGADGNSMEGRGSDELADPTGSEDPGDPTGPRLIAPLDAIPALLDAVETSERVRSAVSAAQMRAGVAVRHSRVAAQRAAGVPVRERARGVAEELALCRRISPARARNQLALERVLVGSMPRTFDLLAGGEISQWSADEVAKAVLVLDDEARARVDEAIAPQLPSVSPRRAGGLARACADELDPRAALARHERAVSERHVSIRPISDALVQVSASLPTAQGVAVYAALSRSADSARAHGAGGSRGSQMADALFTLVTGVREVEDIPVEIQLLMTDRALLGGAPDTAWIAGHPLPGAVARRFALGMAPEAGAEASEIGPGGSGPRPAEARDPHPERRDSPARRFIRRLYTDPVTGQLRAADARRRRFTGHDRRFIEMADQRCRMPWCEAPIRHIDHARQFAAGGLTTIENGAGLCESCNYTVDAPGWSRRMLRGEGGDPVGRILEITTPGGRVLRTAPPPLRIVPPRPDPALRTID
ncbi:HNH endonuclease [Brachybacterium sp. JHP9]|uniref:HNH endonuclease n=1 Tax=Brachybacterium equifaecis TaxID=2910770 RepID=A0ABT0QYP2_9MICO|nr:HNH endonuclease signature motif containing protein [Brachybacterium equifaecis]MCL6422774.1 HNH endonuclease [Brachybacterium equifaecis]